MIRRTSTLFFAPALLLLGACSSSSPSKVAGAPPDAGGADGGAPAPDAGGDDGAATGDDGGGAAAIDYAATLTGGSELPVVTTTATGAAKFTLQPDGVTLSFDVTQSVQGATSVALRLGFAGESGALLHPLEPISAHMTGTVTLTTDEADALAPGQIYLDVQSNAHPSGELRGQVVLPGAEVFVATLEGQQEVPPVTSSFHGFASLILNPGKDTMRYHFFTDAPVTDAHVQRAIGSLNGPVAMPFMPVNQTIDGTFDVMTTDVDDLENGRFYVNVVTASQSSGELRGQVLREGESLFTSVMSGQNEVPTVSTTATGGAQFVLSATKDSMRYEVIVTGIIPTSADVARGAAGQNGSMLGSLMLGGQGALGQMAMPAGDLDALTAGRIYVNVSTASNTNGELRGQLVLR
jgi:hypothetical protein